MPQEPGRIFMSNPDMWKDHLNSPHGKAVASMPMVLQQTGCRACRPGKGTRLRETVLASTCKGNSCGLILSLDDDLLCVLEISESVNLD